MTMVMAGVGRVCVAVLYRAPPNDDEWSRWLALLRERGGQRVRVLVETQNGPNAAQRKALAQATRDMDVRFAIMTDSLIVRGIVTALAWLGVPHHAFAPEQLGQAVAYLELSEAEFLQTRAALLQLRHDAQSCARVATS